MTEYAASVVATYNKKVRDCLLAPGNMVLKRIANPATAGKLGSKWEGPHIITSATRAGSYYIKTPEGQ